MFSARAKAGSSTFSITTIRNTVVSEANTTSDLVSPPTIHVHHFHHHSCLHHPQVLCQNRQPTGSLESSNEDQYAVILNPNSPLRQTQSTLATKQSAFTYTRKPTSTATATIRHPIQTSLPFQRRYFHSPESLQRSHSSSNHNSNCISLTSQVSSPCFLSWDQQHQHQYQQHQQQNQCLGNHVNSNECAFVNGSDHHIPPPSPCSRVITRASLQQNVTPTHVISANTCDSHCRYRLAPPDNTNHHQHPSIFEQQRPCQQYLTEYRVPSDVSQPPCLCHANCNAVDDANFDHRRSQSQPPHRLQGKQTVRPDSGGSNTSAKSGQQQRNNRQTQQTTESSSSIHRRGHFPHWLFPHDHQTKHSRSPPPSTTPPPPPPRSTALRSKPLTRSAEVQTEPPTSQPCCCSNADFCPRLCERENVTRCWCTASQGQPIMLHHYHVHHYYHCDEQLPQQQTPVEVESTSSAVPAEPPGTGFRTSSPLIKLSATWPPNMAIAATEETETTAMMMAIETQSPQQEDCCELSPSTEEAPNPPAHVSNALRAVESPQEQIIPPKEDPQEDQRRVFLQNIAQLKRTGWYWGPLTIEEAELLLKDRPNGSFLVRDSGHELYILSLSFRAENRIYHTRIEHTGGKFGFAIQGGADTTSSSIAQFINHVIAESERGRARFFLRQSALTMSPTADQNGGERVTNQLEGESHHVEARLLYPVSRFLVVHSLAHLCRFEILLKVRKDHIDRLPLPDPLKKYLHERQYYTEFVRAYLESLGGGGESEQSVSETTITSDS